MFSINIKKNKVKLINLNYNLTNREVYTKIWYEKYRIKLPKNEKSSYDTILSYVNNDIYKK
tara:strand:+ start:234 stop:416 length:183 start_codon:yes stop_codon:yes gene_type:complete